ncbi:MAG: sporulation regulator [Verrucomicrobiaceae bacterium]|nr:MAG: sporulation regulator [Verrucomicrobiaceae bacterium]
MKTTITEWGQVSIPAELRHEMHLTPGQTLIWEKISDDELRVRVQPVLATKADPFAAIGFAQRHGLTTHQSTEDFMRELREGEDD